MASRGFSKALRPTAARQIVAPAVQQRTFVAAARNLVRAAAVSGASARSSVSVPFQQTRGVKTMDFAGHKEDVYERADWPQEKLLVSVVPDGSESSLALLLANGPI